jgi:site-specific recombinase XerD
VNVINPDNARIKRRYFHRLELAEGLQPATIEAAARSIADYEEFTSGTDFRAFNEKDAIDYKKKVLARGGRNAAELSSRATARTRLRHVQQFFRWLSGEPSYRSRIDVRDIDFLTLSNRDVRLATDSLEKPTASLAQLQHVVRSMPGATEIEKRDRALLACFLLTGIRVRACISLRLKHIRADQEGIDQDAREVRTKFGKSSSVFFFPVGDDIKALFLKYVSYLRTELLFGDNDALFPRTKIVSDLASGFRAAGLGRTPWADPGPVWRIAKRAFAAAGVPYHSPHSFRRTLVRLGQQTCATPEELKAWSQNLSHDEVTTTLTSYGHVPQHRQAALLKELVLISAPSADALTKYGPMLSDPFVQEFLDRLRRS